MVHDLRGRIAFTDVGGSSRNRIAAISSAGAATYWNPNANGLVRALAVTQSTVSRGDFSSMAVKPGSRLAALNGAGEALWSLDPRTRRDRATMAVGNDHGFCHGRGFHHNRRCQAVDGIAALDTGHLVSTGPPGPTDPSTLWPSAADGV